MSTESAMVLPGAQFTPEALMERETEDLCRDWLRAKFAEEKCREWRLAVENAMEARLEHPIEGSKTHSVGDCKVTLTARLYRKMDWTKWEEIKERVPTDLRPVKVIEELDETGVKWLAKNRPDIYQTVCEAITTTPGKIGVKVARKEE